MSAAKSTTAELTSSVNPTARATAKHVRVTPMKARRVVDMVRGKRVEDALSILRFAPQATVLPLKAPPVVGAALLGLDRREPPNREEAEKRLRGELTYERLFGSILAA